MKPPKSSRKRPKVKAGAELRHLLASRDVLLRAAYDLLKKAEDAFYVQDPLEVTVFYHDAICDGSCLKDDIANELGLEDGAEPLAKP